MFPFHDNNPTYRWSIVTYSIIAINALCWISISLLPEEKQLAVVMEYGFVPARVRQLSDPQLIVSVHAPRDSRIPAGVPPEVVHQFRPEPTQIVLSMFTSMFLHGSWMHLLGNMWFLFIFGNNVEDRLGHVLYTLFYILGGLVALACHWLTNPSSTIPVIGASGAVAAVLGGYAVTFPHARVKTLVFLVFIITVIELPAMAVLGFWFVMQLLEGVGTLNVSGGVAWWAHVGGFVAGMAMMPLFSAIAPQYPPVSGRVREYRSPDWEA